jgi:hypothetical protein
VTSTLDAAYKSFSARQAARMAEDSIPEILAEQHLGHEVPGMRGLYAHAPNRMRDDLKHALQDRWEDSLRARAAIHPHSPVPLLDEFLVPFREPAEPRETVKQPATPGDSEKMISQIPPNHAESPSHGTGWGPRNELLTWSETRSSGWS